LQKALNQISALHLLPLKLSTIQQEDQLQLLLRPRQRQQQRQQRQQQRQQWQLQRLSFHLLTGQLILLPIQVFSLQLLLHQRQQRQQ